MKKGRKYVLQKVAQYSGTFILTTLLLTYPNSNTYATIDYSKEELFNNTLDVNVNVNDINSNNTLDLGGLGDLMGMTEAKVIEAKNKEVNN